jgi:hypothetical protein
MLKLHLKSEKKKLQKYIFAKKKDQEKIKLDFAKKCNSKVN